MIPFSRKGFFFICSQSLGHTGQSYERDISTHPPTHSTALAPAPAQKWIVSRSLGLENWNLLLSYDSLLACCQSTIKESTGGASRTWLTLLILFFNPNWLFAVISKRRERWVMFGHGFSSSLFSLFSLLCLFFRYIS